MKLFIILGSLFFSIQSHSSETEKNKLQNPYYSFHKIHYGMDQTAIADKLDKLKERVFYYDKCAKKIMKFNKSILTLNLSISEKDKSRKTGIELWRKNYKLWEEETDPIELKINQLFNEHMKLFLKALGFSPTVNFHDNLGYNYHSEKVLYTYKKANEATRKNIYQLNKKYYSLLIEEFEKLEKINCRHWTKLQSISQRRLKKRGANIR